MKRRKVIKLSAYVASGSLIGMLSNACKTDSIAIDLEGYTPSFLSKDQYSFINSFADTLLPETDTPGAVSVGVPQIYDSIMNNILTADQKNKALSQLQDLMKHVKAKNMQTGLLKLSEEERLQLFTSVDKGLSDQDSQIAKTYKTVKNQIIQYYLNTEEVGTKLLNYLPVPGEYNACVSLEELGGKAWTI